jgi:nitrate/TMAO reductase-like tetraheme cytochrome c subunit
MKTSQKLILMIMLTSSVVSISMTQAFSVGTGQHQFRTIDMINPQQFCSKCHGSNDGINAELSTSGNGNYNGGIRIHSTQTCVSCHQITQGYNTAFQGQKSEHAATIPTCLKCHNTVMMFNVTQELSNTHEAHNTFRDDVACIGCHTSVKVQGAVSYTLTSGQNTHGLKIGD